MSFRMVNDQSGEEVTADVSNEQDYRARGFRVHAADANAYLTQTRMAEARAAAGNAPAPAAVNRAPAAEDDAAAGTADPLATREAMHAALMNGTADKMREFAQRHNIDLGEATKKEDMANVIVAARFGGE